MACPKCNCKDTYPHYEDDDAAETDLERCAHCWHIFYIEDAADEDDEECMSFDQVFRPLPKEEAEAVQNFLPPYDE